MLTQGRSTRGKNGMVEQTVANDSAMGWAESIKWGVKTPAIVHRRMRDDVEKQ